MFPLHVGDKDDCDQTIEVMNRAKPLTKGSSNARSNTTVRRVDRAPPTPDETQLEEEVQEGVDECESEKEELDDKDDESPLVLVSNQDRSIRDGRSPSPVLPLQTNDASPHPETGKKADVSTYESVLRLLLVVEASNINKRKDPPVHSSPILSTTGKRPKTVGFVSMREHANLVAQLAHVNDENMLYTTTWMRKFRPSSSVSIFFTFIDT